MARVWWYVLSYLAAPVSFVLGSAIIGVAGVGLVREINPLLGDLGLLVVGRSQGILGLTILSPIQVVGQIGKAVRP